MVLAKPAEKIMHYLSALTPDKNIIISPGFGKDYTCPEGCGGCCFNFSLDYFPGERWETFKKHYPEEVDKFEFNGKFYTNDQKSNPTRKCLYLTENGRCKIHLANPWSCEFELNKIMHHKRKNNTYLLTKIFGRGWNLPRVDGVRGALCQVTKFTPERFIRDIELYKELNEIAECLGVKTRIPEIVKYLEDNKEYIINMGGITNQLVFKLQ